MGISLSGTGVWSAGLRHGDRHAAADAVAELESLGYEAAWMPDVGGDVFSPVDNLLGATRDMVVATGILNLWMHTPEETARRHAELCETHGRRFLAGIGVSHAPVVDTATGAGRYRQPLRHMAEFLDGLDAAPIPLAPEERVLAALGPKMVGLARARSAGTHPYLVTPEHTAATREAIGPNALVAVEQAVVLASDAGVARTLARQHLSVYVTLPNYVNNWKRLGFTDDDVAGGGTDRLVDALVAWGDDVAIATRIAAHRAAGADHVCVQVLAESPRVLPRDEWRQLAPAIVAR